MFSPGLHRNTHNIHSNRTARAIQRNPVSKKKTKQKQKTKPTKQTKSCSKVKQG
jgi:hypothetical protein